MKYAYILFGFLLVLCVSCETPQSQFENSGSLSYNGTAYALKSARLKHYKDTTTGDNRFQLVLCSSTMSYLDEKMSGYGELLCITIATESNQLVPQTYESNSGQIVLAESYLLHISSDKKDTVKTEFSTGSLQVLQSEHGQKYTFTLDSTVRVTGSYEGSVTYSHDIDGVQVGSLVVGDSIIPLQRGDLMFWGSIFGSQLHYYEFYFYSCNLRYNDAGAIKQGVMFVVGLQSENSTLPTEGVYPISRKNEAQTALYGHRDGNANWGTYWVEYLSSVAHQKAYVMRDSVAFSRTDGVYEFTFQCTDQLSNAITGTYHGDFNLMDVR